MAKKVNLNAHDTHMSSQTNAGISLNAPAMNPNEVSLWKEKRDIEMRNHDPRMYRGVKLFYSRACRKE